MDKQQFLNKWHFTGHCLISQDLDAVIAHEIAKAQPEKQNTMVQEKHLKELFKYIEANWDVCVEDVDKRDIKRIFGGVLCDDIMKDADQVTDQVTDHEQPEMTEKEKIDHILTNKLTWKPMGNKQFYANMFSAKASDGSRQVYFVDYNNPHSGYFETRIFKIDLTEWQPVETEKPSSQVKLDNSFDKDRFEAMFRAVVASGEYVGMEFEKTEEALIALDTYYASKEGGANE